MRKTLGVALVLLLLLGTISPASTAELGTENSLAVFITYPYGDYEIGSQVNVTVHVFQAGEYFDPDGVDLEIRESGKYVDLTRTATGVYTGSFVIVWEDLSDYLGVYLDADADPISGYSVRDTVLVDTVYSRFQVYSIWLTPVEGELRPGQDITLEVQATYQGEFVDPDPGSIRVHVHDHDTEGDPINLDTTRIGVGRYRASTSLPDDATSSALFEVGVSANLTITIPTAHGDEEYTDSTGGWRSYGMDLFDVWGNLKEVSRDEILVDLYVRDDDGLPVVDADVSLEFSYMAEWWNKIPFGTEDGQTDENGSLATIIDLSDVPDNAGTIWVEGNVTSDGSFQEIQTILFVSEDNNTGLGRQGDFYVDIIDEEMSYENGSLWLKNRATSYGDELSDTEVYVYVVTEYDIVNHSAEETDASGEFEVEFQVPDRVEFGAYKESFATTYYHALINGSWMFVEETHINGTFDAEGLSVPPDEPQTILQVGPAVPGENLSIEFSNPVLDGVDEVASVLWGIGAAPMDRPNLPEWRRWTPSSAWPAGGYAECQWTGQGYVANVSVPDFLPVGTKLSIVPMISSLDVVYGSMMGPFRWITVSEENSEPVTTIIEPAEDEVVSGTVTVQGTAADDIAVEMVEIRIDDGDWIDAVGTGEWTFDLDTTGMEHGEHTLRVRSYDGTTYSDEKVITFIVDEPPELVEISLATGETLRGTVTLTGEVSDDEEVEVVQVRIDDDDWEDVAVDEQGTWSHELVTTDLDHGAHTLDVRVSDGVWWSDTVSVAFEVDQVPMVTIMDPVAGGTYTDNFFFNISASDDADVLLLEVRVDGGEWTSLGSIDRYSDHILVEDLVDGEHTYEARAFDGDQFSEVDIVTFTVERDEPRPQTSETNWLYVSIVVVVVVGIIIGVWYRGQRRS